MADHAFDEFYRQYYAWVKSYASRRGAPDPDEIAQATLTKAYERWETLDRSSPWPWLGTVARNLMIDASRRRKREDFNGIESVELPTAPHEDPAERVVHIDRVRLLKEALQDVRPPERVLITRKYLEEATYDELSDEYGVSNGAMRQRVCRAVNRLEPHARKRGIVAIPVAAAFGWLVKLFRRHGTLAPAGSVAGVGTLVLAVGIGTVIANSEDSERANPQVAPIQQYVSVEPSARTEVAGRIAPSATEPPLRRRTDAPAVTELPGGAAPSAPPIEATVNVPPPDPGPGKKEGHSVKVPLPIGDVVTYNDAYTTGHVLDPACQNGIDACGEQP